MSRSKKTDAKDMMPREYYEKCKTYYSDVYKTQDDIIIICKIDGNKPVNEVLGEVLTAYEKSKKSLGLC